MWVGWGELRVCLKKLCDIINLLMVIDSQNEIRAIYDFWHCDWKGILKFLIVFGDIEFSQGNTILLQQLRCNGLFLHNISNTSIFLSAHTIEQQQHSLVFQSISFSCSLLLLLQIDFPFLKCPRIITQQGYIQ